MTMTSNTSRGKGYPFIWTSAVVLLGLGGLTWALNGGGSSFLLSDQQSEVYYTIGISAGDKIKVDKDTQIIGNLYSNKDVDLKKDTSVTGDVSAVKRAHVRGTVSGAVTENAAPLPLPSLLDEDSLRALADRIFDEKTTFTDAVIDDIIFVDGDARFEGSLNGTGTIIATRDIRIGKDDKVELSALTLALPFDFVPDTPYTVEVVAREPAKGKGKGKGKGNPVIDVEIVSLSLVSVDPITVDDNPGSKDGNLVIDSISPMEVQFSLSVDPTDKLKEEVEFEVAINGEIFGPVLVFTRNPDIPDEGALVGEFEVDETTAKLKPGFTSVSLATDFDFLPGVDYTVTATLLDGKGNKTRDVETASFVSGDLPLENVDANAGAKEGNLRIDAISELEVLLTLEITEKKKLEKDYQVELEIAGPVEGVTVLGPQEIETGDKSGLAVGDELGLSGSMTWCAWARSRRS